MQHNSYEASCGHMKRPKIRGSNRCIGMICIQSYIGIYTIQNILWCVPPHFSHNTYSLFYIRQIGKFTKKKVQHFREHQTWHFLNVEVLASFSSSFLIQSTKMWSDVMRLDNSSSTMILYTMCQNLAILSRANEACVLFQPAMIVS